MSDNTVTGDDDMTRLKQAAINGEDADPTLRSEAETNIGHETDGETSVLPNEETTPGSICSSQSPLVINELLCYIMNKSHIMPKQEIAQIVADFYMFEDIQLAKSLLFQHAPQSVGRIKKRKGEKKSLQSAMDIYDTIQQCEAEQTVLPVFVAADLSKMPAVDIDRVDAATIAQELSFIRKQKCRHSTLDEELGLKSAIDTFNKRTV